jgi:hypothetical protein
VTAREPAVFEPLPGITLGIQADEGTLGHFSAEYGASIRPDGTSPSLEVVIGGENGDHAQWAAEFRDRHKSVGWEVRLSSPHATPLQVRLELRGQPGWLVRSLVQGFVIEPLLSVVAARNGAVLLPAAALEEAGGAVVILGASRTGKSTVSAHALAVGRAILGDDQVYVDPDGSVQRFPRRLRLYDDLGHTAPTAFRKLPASVRRGLLVRRWIRLVSAGRIAPSLAVDPALLGSVLSGPLPIRRILLVQRADDDRGPSWDTTDVGAAVRFADELLIRQRARFSSRASGPWRDAIDAARTAERRALEKAFDRLPIARFLIPATLGAPQAISLVRDALGLPASV